MSDWSKILPIAALTLGLVPCHAAAQDAEELAKQTQNPVSSLTSVPLQGTAPLLFSLSKVTVLGKRPISFVLAAGPTIASPDGGAEWRFRLGATFLFPR